TAGLIGRSRIPNRRDVRIEESWPRFRPNRWLVERSPPQVIQREISRVLVLNLSGDKKNGAKTGSVLICLCTGVVCVSPKPLNDHTFLTRRFNVPEAEPRFVLPTYIVLVNHGSENNRCVAACRHLFPIAIPKNHKNPICREPHLR